MPDPIHDAYWSLIGLYTGFSDENVNIITAALFGIGFALVAAGCASKPTRDLKGGSDDPKEYLFTHRPRGFLLCLMIPWNILTAAWRLKKVPIILPIIFVPFMLPFALIADIILAVLFVIVWAVMNIRIKLAASKDRAIYDRDTQYAVCPKCKRNFYQPNVKCMCGLVVSFPVPNKYGVKYHTCNKGHKIPCTNENSARGKMKAVCPHCKGEMFTHDAKPIVLSLVGSVGSGKTTMMLSAIESITALAKDRGIVCEVISDGISVDAQRKKQRALPTRPGELDSEYFFLRSRDLSEKEVVINDISGVEFQPDRDKVLFEEYYRYNDGIIFVIDPLEVLALHHSQSPTKGSKNTPIATLESFYHMYTEINGYGPAVKSTVPFAVVLTKMDDPRTKSAVSAETSPTEFLINHSHKMFVDIAQSAFNTVRYFKVASLGENNNAIEPFLWILTENDKNLKDKLS
ncbi:MAG: GTPase domain-containing protein [Methanomassiliicoccaceae archaeon]|nr:GTPase domain-containing protein [Methanomassiliicoccaceae archaeon]